MGKFQPKARLSSQIDLLTPKGKINGSFHFTPSGVNYYKKHARAPPASYTWLQLVQLILKDIGKNS